jgi:hypothetical protein
VKVCMTAEANDLRVSTQKVAALRQHDRWSYELVITRCDSSRCKSV